MSKLLDKKTEELVALGAAYAINCVKCMKVHKKAALGVGVSESEMSEALSVAEGVVTGARAVTKNEAESIFGSEVVDNRCCPEGSDCCP
jgi:AhpD family alkylhydroperoxidase